MAALFWLSDAQWAAIEPPLPDLGGRPRVGDRPVISGILHRFREGLRWRAVPDAYGPTHHAVQSVQPMEQARAVAATVRGTGYCSSRSSRGLWCQRGEQS